MLSKNSIDKKLKGYIRKHLSKGYSGKSVRKVLVEHGYDEGYVDGLLRKHNEVQFVKKYSAVVSLLFLISIFAFNILPLNNKQEVTGFATVISSSNEGCCLPVCQQTAKGECYGRFIENKKCDELEECTVGCCIDKEGYCLQNYLYGNCISGNGSNVYKDCNDITFCKNITDKSYWARAYSINGKKGAGFASIKPIADYYKSFFNIRYFIYDKTNVVSISASIKDGATIVATVQLYDDGSHNDGAEDDNLYANNWDSSELGAFDGFKNLEVDIIVELADGTKQTVSNAQSFAVLKNNKCLPIYSMGSDRYQKFGVIFAAQGYDNLSDGWDEFESDANSVINSLFSLDKFSANKDLFNFYRLEESLTYPDVAALESVASKSCPSYNKNKDIIILLDKGEDYCVEESQGIVKINPQVLFYKNASEIEAAQLLLDFCKYALTPKTMADIFLDFVGPPKIIIGTLDNITYKVSKINLTFNISSKNYPVVDSVFLDNVQLYNKTIDKDAEEIVELNLVNGTNQVTVDAEDKNENIAFAQILLNATIE